MTFTITKAGMQNGSGDSQAERWMDLFPVPYIQGTSTAALTTGAVRDSLFRANFFSSTQNDDVSFSYQMPHNWVIGSSVRPHLHFIPHGTGSEDGYLVMDGYYSWTYIGNDTLQIPQQASWTYFRTKMYISSADFFEEKVISTDYIAPPTSFTTNSYGRSAHLHIFWRRPATLDSEDNFISLNPTGGGVANANIQVVSFDCHVLVKGSGSVNEYAIPY